MARQPPQLDLGLISAAAGNVVILSIGALWLGIFTHASAGGVLTQAVVPFLPGDALKVVAAGSVRLPVEPHEPGPPSHTSNRLVSKGHLHSVSTQKSGSAAAEGIREISIAHSPDSDDAFMFYGLATNKIRVPGYRFTHTLTDIETLNRRAQDEAFYDVSAISFHAYPYVQDNYTLMGCGGSVGEGYGPMVVSSKKLTP